MKLVIEIPDGYDVTSIQNGSIASKVVLNAVKNGIPIGGGRMTVDFAKEYLLDDCADCPENKDGECMTQSHCFEVKRMAIQALEQINWIPVSERLPEEKDMGWFLVTRVLPNQLPTVEKAYYVYITEYERNWLIEEYTYDCKSPYITAWMPLPQPYNAESEGKK